jgi:hypothetical protein
VKVNVPSPLFSYTAQRSEVEAKGASLTELLAQDRLRPHMRIFVNRQETRELGTALAGDEEIHIFQALSGG